MFPESHPKMIRQRSGSKREAHRDQRRAKKDRAEAGAEAEVAKEAKEAATAAAPTAIVPPAATRGG